jgi:hypothetical protein
VLRYEAGGYNRLHRDLYGALVFPLQATVLLSEPGRDFEGGEFLLVEQRARMQSKAEVVPLARGDAVIFAVNFRPGRGARGFHKVALRHGVSVVRAGRRHALGIIFHDASDRLLRSPMALLSRVDADPCRLMNAGHLRSDAVLDNAGVTRGGGPSTASASRTVVRPPWAGAPRWACLTGHPTHLLG